MISFPNCKVNLGLHIVDKRPDGYHNLETVFYPLPLTDVLEIIPGSNLSPSSNLPSFTITGLPVAGATQTNLCLKAWHLIRNEFPDLPAVSIHLHKNIPMGAGLGGGSADGAFTLRMLNELFNLEMNNEKLATAALTLGSDCPFFIYNSPVFAKGRGEIIQPVSLDLSGYSWLIVNPGIHIGTAQAFSRITPAHAPVQLDSAILQPVEEWPGLIKNDFEEPAYYYYPELREVKNWLYESGALYASMTGSGSCFFGIFAKHKIPTTNTIANWDLHAII